MELDGVAALVDQRLVGLDGAFTDRGENDSADALLQTGGSNLRGGGSSRGLDSLAARTFPAFLAAQNGLENTSDLGLVGGLVVDDSVRAGVKSVGGNCLAGFLIDQVNHTDGSARGVVHVEDGRLRVETGSVEGVAVLHGQAGKSAKVLVGNRLLHLLHAVGNGVGDALGEESRGSDRLLHTSGAADVLLFCRSDKNDGAHVGPVLCGRNLNGHTVAAVLLASHLPSDISAKQTTAC